MTIRRVLIFAPILLIIVLLQSYFWVPTYEQQTRGNPQRLNEYITGSIGDASLLNPILSADSASSNIANMVFEGLIDRDEQLRFRGRLATSWEIYEEAFFYVNKSFKIPGLGEADPQELVNFIKEAKKKKITTEPRLRDSLDRITEISIIPPRNFSAIKQAKDLNKGNQKKDIKISIAAPARIKLVLNRVDQDLFQNLAYLLGKDYFESFHSEDNLSATPHPGKEKLAAMGYWWRHRALAIVGFRNCPDRQPASHYLACYPNPNSYRYFYPFRDFYSRTVAYSVTD